MLRFSLGVLMMLLALGPTSAQAQIDTLWTRLLGPPLGSRDATIISLSEGRFAVVGTTENNEGEAVSIVVAGDGEVVDTWTHDTSADVHVEGALPLRAGGFLIFGRAVVGFNTTPDCPRGPTTDAFVARVDERGETQWMRTTAGNLDAAFDSFLHGIETEDGHFLLAEISSSCNAGANVGSIARLDPLGTLLWSSNTVKFDSYAVPWTDLLAEQPDGSFLVLNPNKSQTALVEYSRDGRASEPQVFDFRQRAWVETDEGDFVGLGFHYDSDPEEARVIRLSPAGEVVWDVAYPIQGTFMNGEPHLAKLPEGRFLAVIPVEEGLFVLAFDAEGQLVTHRLFRLFDPSTPLGAYDRILPTALVAASENEALYAGLLDDRNSTDDRMLLMRIHVGTHATFVDGGPAGVPALRVESVFPNPAHTQATLVFELPAPTALTLDVFDTLGRRVARLADGVYPAGRHHAAWNMQDAPRGLYLYRLRAGTHTATGAVVVGR